MLWVYGLEQFMFLIICIWISIDDRLYNIGTYINIINQGNIRKTYLQNMNCIFPYKIIIISCKLSAKILVLLFFYHKIKYIYETIVKILFFFFFTQMCMFKSVFATCVFLYV